MLNQNIPGPGDEYTSQVAYIALPSDIDRDEYVRSCYKQLRVSVKTEDGAFINRVPISALWLNFVRFPEDSQTNGTPVLIENIPQYNHKIIVTLLPEIEEVSDLREHEFKFKRKLKNSVVEIQGSPKSGCLSLTVDSDETSEISINVYNKNKDGILKINVNGDIQINADEFVTVSAAKGISLISYNEDDESKYGAFSQSNEESHFDTQKFKINEGEQAIALGNELKTIMDSLFTKLGQSTVTTALGQMPLLNAIQLADLKKETDKILSKVSFTD